jgi:hypothetical protein
VQAEAAGLHKERVRHVRMGNKSNVAAIDARLATLDPKRQVRAIATGRKLRGCQWSNRGQIVLKAKEVR